MWKYTIENTYLCAKLDTIYRHRCKWKTQLDNEVEGSKATSLINIKNYYRKTKIKYISNEKRNETFCYKQSVTRKN